MFPSKLSTSITMRNDDNKDMSVCVEYYSSSSIDISRVIKERGLGGKTRGIDNGDDGDETTDNQAPEIMASVSSPIPIRNDTNKDRPGGVENYNRYRMVSPRLIREIVHGRDKRRMVSWLVKITPFDKNSAVEDEEDLMVVTVRKFNSLKNKS